MERSSPMETKWRVTAEVSGERQVWNVNAEDEIHAIVRVQRYVDETQALEARNCTATRIR